ncbi:aldo/keto reductase [Terribacillus saccharophilus]|uniref:aldo/keto reductase n=1 Tax=Terribacillus saccharophilus TaxID=361277 RepID=UPI003981A896
MKKVKLGTSDLKVTQIALGTWAMGGYMWQRKPNEDSAKRTVHAAIDQGINFIDTAPDYGLGKSEEFIGKALQESSIPRDQLILAGKPGVNWTDDIQLFRDMRPESVEKELDLTLKRLGTDYLDLYQVHWPDHEIPMEELAGIMHDLYKKGKIRAIGVSNFTPQEMEAFQREAPLHVTQNQFNMLQRGLWEWFDYAKRHNIGGLAWGPMAHGLLAGALTKSAAFSEDDFRSSHPLFESGRFEAILDAVEQLKNFAANRDKTIAQLAMRWVLEQDGVDVAIWGAYSPEQVSEVSGVTDLSLTKENLLAIDQILKLHIDDWSSNYLDAYAPPERSTVNA